MMMETKIASVPRVTDQASSVMRRVMPVGFSKRQALPAGSAVLSAVSPPGETPLIVGQHVDGGLQHGSSTLHEAAGLIEGDDLLSGGKRRDALDGVDECRTAGFAAVA